MYRLICGNGTLLQTYETGPNSKTVCYNNDKYRKHSPAVRVRVPRLLVHLQGPFGRQQPDEGGHLRRQVVDLVRVLTRGVSAP